MVATYQSVSGTGQAASTSSRPRRTRRCTAWTAPPPSIYPEPIAFNVIGAAGNFADGDDHTDEERKMMFETRKILEDESIGVAVTCVRVPVRVGHSLAVNLETREPLSAEQAPRAAGQRARGSASRTCRPAARGGPRRGVRRAHPPRRVASPSALGMWVVSATTCERAPPPTRSRSPSCSPSSVKTASVG